MSADLGLDEKNFQEIHYHIWDYHPCRFEAKIKTPPTFMKCGINFLKMLIIVITYNICSFFIYLHYFFKGIYLRNILSYNKYTFGLINFWFDAVRSTFRGDPIFSLQKHSSHLARLYFGLFFCCQNSNITWLFINLFSIN